MKFLLVLLSSFAVAFTQNYELEAEWSSYKLAYGKTYESPEEEELRKQIFVENLKKIEEHNALYEAGNVTHYLGLNQFADMTDGEFEQFLGIAGPMPALDENATLFKPNPELKLPESLDYRKQSNIVNPPRQQGACGSCWAFSSLAALESVYALKHGRLLSLSPQNLVDCARPWGANGCHGGNINIAYVYIKSEGVTEEARYPYTAKDDSLCRYKPSMSVLKLKGHQWIQREDLLQKALVQNGPVALHVDASEWKLYKGGIFKPSEPFKKMTHGVVVVGYGKENGHAYWILRNSYGPDWGEHGYMRIVKGINACALASYGVQPSV